MFWTSISHGLKILVHPSVALTTVVFLGVQILFLGLIRWATQKKELEDAASAGCLTQLLAVFIQTLVLSLFLLLLMPVLLGLEPRISWVAVEPFTMLAARAGLVAALVVSILAFLPWLGTQLAGSPGLEMLLGGGILFRLLSHPYLEARLGGKIPTASLYPGIWECLGYLLLAFLTGRLLMLGLTKRRSGPTGASDDLTRVWGPSLDCLIGIVVLYMYAQYVALRLHPH